MNPSPAKSEELLILLSSKLGNQVLESSVELGDVVVRVRSESISDFLKILKLDRELSFNFLVDITAIDWMDQGQERFELVYHLLSLSKLYRLRVKSWVSEQKPEVASVTPIWAGANYFEREVWDMYGIKFIGHPDLRRILMYDEFQGYPLRKDYPVQAKQPRVPLRYPEVENTARDMQRPELVQIRKRNLQNLSHGSPQ